MKRLGIVFILVGLVMEAEALLFLFNTDTSPIFAALLHIGSALGLTIGLMEWEINWSILGGILALSLPGVGYLGALLLAAKTVKSSDKFGHTYEDYRQHITQYTGPQPIVKHIENKDEFLSSELDFIPIIDHLKDTDVMMRIGSLRACREFGDRWSIKMLFMGTADPHPEVRLKATEELATLNEMYQEEIHSATNEIAMWANDPVSHNTLGNLALEYYETGLINDQRYLDMAEKQYLISVKLSKGQVDVYNSLGRIMIIKKNPQEGLRYYQEALKIEPKNVRARIGLLECYWSAGRYEKMPELSRQIINDKPNGFLDILYFWADLSMNV